MLPNINLKIAVRGFSLTELMITLVVGSLVSIGVMSVFASQSVAYMQQTNRIRTIDASNSTFDLLYRLLQQANAGSITITDNNGITRGGIGSGVLLNDGDALKPNDHIIIDFTLPAGFRIWPNNIPDAAGNFVNNFVRIRWANTGTDKYKIIIANRSVPTAADFNDNQIILSGVDSNTNSRILNLDYWPVQADGITPEANIGVIPPGSGYRLVVTSSIGADTTGGAGVHTQRGLVSPRN